MQTEVPAWGSETFEGMAARPDADIMENGLQQLQEMIAGDRNHPSVVVWGLGNEIGGQNPAAYQFAKRMLEELSGWIPGVCAPTPRSRCATLPSVMWLD